VPKHKQVIKAPQKHENASEQTTATEDLQNENLADEIDDLLDEIDEVLEVNAEAFVNNYIQKGGQ
jgi:ubiquitin-like protein Pup